MDEIAASYRSCLFILVVSFLICLIGKRMIIFIRIIVLDNQEDDVCNLTSPKISIPFVFSFFFSRKNAVSHGWYLNRKLIIRISSISVSALEESFKQKQCEQHVNGRQLFMWKRYSNAWMIRHSPITLVLSCTSLRCVLSNILLLKIRNKISTASSIDRCSSVSWVSSQKQCPMKKRCTPVFFFYSIDRMTTHTHHSLHHCYTCC